MWNSLPQEKVKENSKDTFRGRQEKHTREKGVEGYTDRRGKTGEAKYSMYASGLHSAF